MATSTETEYRHGLADYVTKFKSLDTDDQLAVLWEVYQGIGGERLENPDDNKESDNSSDLYNTLKEKSDDEQLQFMRDVLSEAGNDNVNQYRQLSDTTKVALWYRLGQGMESNDVVGAGEYSLSDEAKEIVSAITSVSFEQCYIFMRDALLLNN